MPIFYSFLKHFLKAWDIIFKRAADIFSQLIGFKPDLLIIDVVLEGSDGRELCRQLKASDENKELVILLTSASPTNLKDYKSWMADDCIEKPFDIYEFEKKVQAMLTYPPTRNKVYTRSS